MMKERYLIVADSVLELIITLQLKLSLLKDTDATLVLTDRTSSSESVANRMRQLDIFDRVLYVEAKREFPKTQERRHAPQSIKDFLFRKGCTRETQDIIGECSTYTGFITSEPDYFSRYMYEAIKKTATPFFIAESGFGFGGLKESIEQYRKNDTKDCKRRNITSFFDDIEGIYYYGPMLEEMDWGNWIPIPNISNYRERLVDILNYVFDYTPHANIFQNKIILFEESYATDGGTDNFAEIVTQLADEFGNDKIMIKRHPRDTENRFRKMNIQSIEPYSLPWEIFVLNGDCRNCILMAANSTSVYMTNILDYDTGHNQVVMLRNVMEYTHSGNYPLDSYYKFLCKLYEKFEIPTPMNMEEVNALIRKIM